MLNLCINLYPRSLYSTITKEENQKTKSNLPTTVSKSFILWWIYQTTRWQNHSLKPRITNWIANQVSPQHQDGTDPTN